MLKAFNKNKVIIRNKIELLCKIIKTDIDITT